MLTSVAFVFPGQGSQVVGMGADLCARSAIARALFSEADDALGFALSRIILAGPEETLRQTAFTQPAILLVSIAAYRVLDLEPAAVAGHSLGEYSALVAAGSLTFRDAIQLVHKRGRYMQEAVPDGEGAMLALIGAEPAAVAAAIAAEGGAVDIANDNAPGQVVIAGVAAAARRVAAAAGARQAIELPVSAPFHCRLMAPAEARLRLDLDALPIAPPRLPVYCNVDAVRVSSATAVRDALARQVSRTVRWTELMRRMIEEEHLTTCVEVGPGVVLSGLIRRIDRSVQRLQVADAASIDAARAQLTA